MVITKKAILAFLLVMTTLFGATLGAVYKVGDSVGWTMMGVDYNKWASTKTFHVGDSVVFQYVSDYHDVNEVIHQNFLLCDASSPIATYETGLDSINLTQPGHHYYLCGVPGHCEAGQKLDVMVMPVSLRTRSLQPVPPALPPISSSPSAALRPYNPIATSPEMVLVKNGATRFWPLMGLSYLAVFGGGFSFFF